MYVRWVSLHCSGSTIQAVRWLLLGPQGPLHERVFLSSPMHQTSFWDRFWHQAAMKQCFVESFFPGGLAAQSNHISTKLPESPCLSIVRNKRFYPPHGLQSWLLVACSVLPVDSF